MERQLNLLALYTKLIDDLLDTQRHLVERIEELEYDLWVAETTYQ